MSSSKRKSSDLKTVTENRIVYSEFGNGDNSAALKRSAPDNSAALERGVPELPPNQQDLRVQASRKGRKGKTVTIITGFQSKPETLNTLLKHLKTQCGTGGTVKDNTIEIQGDCGQRLVQVLIQQGYKAKISGG